MIEFKSETHVTDNGARGEVGTVTFEGRDFAALGSVVDEARGIVCAYVTQRAGAYVLTTWEGKTIAPLRLAGTWKNSNTFFGAPVRMHAWAAVISGRHYSGRNAGPDMFVRMRAGKKARPH